MAPAEGFFGLVADLLPPVAGSVDSAPATDSAVAEDDPPAEDAVPDDDTGGADAAMAIFMGLPLAPVPPQPAAGQTATQDSDLPQPEAAQPTAAGLPLPVPPSAGLGAAAPPKPVQANPTPKPAPSPLTAAPTATTTPAEAATADAAGSAVESAARFRLDQADAAPAEDVLLRQIATLDGPGESAPTVAVGTDPRPEVRTADMPAPHRRAAGHLTKLLADVGGQLATQDSRTELTLAPEELGRIRFDIRQHGDSLVVTLTADRPETLDLMRRHANDLRSELAAAGYGSATLDFGGSEHPQQSSSNAAGLPSLDSFGDAPAAPSDSPTPLAFQRSAAADGLDLRL